MNSKASLTLQSALLSTGLVQPVTIENGKGFVEMLCRQTPGQDKEWLKAVEDILRLQFPEGVTVKVGTRFVLKDDKLVKGAFIYAGTKRVKAFPEVIERIVETLEVHRANLNAVVERRPVVAAVAPKVEVAPEDVVTGPVRLDPKEVAKHTTASPRPPDGSDPDPVIPAGSQSPTIKMIRNEITEGGVRVTEHEMPLPNIYKELNKPNERGRGAWKPQDFGKAFQQLHPRR
jgi:hypothetical protein